MQAQIAARVLRVRAGDLLPPLHNRLVVVCAYVTHAIRRIGVRQIVAGLARVKGELEDLHSREAGVLDQLRDARRQIAQVLRYEARVVEPVAQHAHEADSRPCAPLAVYRGGVAVGHRPVAVKAAEMVYAYDVVEVLRVLDAAYPPAIAVGFHMLPVVEGIAPELAVGREIVRRHARHSRRHIALVQQEALGVAPHVGAVQCDVYRDIADYLYAQRVDVLTQGVPLFEEQVLRVREEAYVAVELAAVFIKRLVLAHARVLIRPLNPALHAEMPFESHEQGIVRQPAAVGLNKSLNLFRVTLPAALRRQGQHLETVLVYFAVVDVHRVPAPVDALYFLPLKQAVVDKQVQVDKVRIARRS